MQKDAKRLADTAVLAGQIMLESNAESYRVEDTMNFILNSSKFNTCEAFAMATGVFVTLDDPTIENITVVKRVKKVRINLKKIVQVNAISRKIVSNEINVDQAYNSLIKLHKSDSHNLAKSLGIMIMCGGFAGIYGGGAIEIILAFLISGFLSIADIVEQKLELETFFKNVLSIIPMVALVVLIKNNLFKNLNEVITISSVIMPTLPGTAITNAIRDTFRGDYNSGAARMLEAFVIALSVAIGVALGLVITGGGI